MLVGPSPAPLVRPASLARTGCIHRRDRRGPAFRCLRSTPTTEIEAEAEVSQDHGASRTGLRLRAARDVAVVPQVSQLHLPRERVRRDPPPAAWSGPRLPQSPTREGLGAQLLEGYRSVLHHVVKHRRHARIRSVHAKHHAERVEDVGRAGLVACPSWASAAIAIARSSVAMLPPRALHVMATQLTAAGATEPPS
jgi:hypothetical protein